MYVNSGICGFDKLTYTVAKRYSVRENRVSPFYFIVRIVGFEPTCLTTLDPLVNFGLYLPNFIIGNCTKSLHHNYKSLWIRISS